MYSQRPSSFVESEDWTALRRFRFDEAVMIAGIYAERRANEEARASTEDEAQVHDANSPSGRQPSARAGAVQAGHKPEIDLATGTFMSGVIPFIGNDDM